MRRDPSSPARRGKRVGEMGRAEPPANPKARRHTQTALLDRYHAMVVEAPAQPQTSVQIRRIAERAPWWERNLAWLLVAPTMLMFLFFAVYPTITAVLFSVSRARLIRGGLERTYIGLDNFRRAFEDPLVRQSARFTIKWTISVTIIEVVLGLGIALLVTNLAWGRGLLTSL